MTQKQTVYEHMLTHGSITSMEAFSLYKITRLSEYIHELRKEGKPVITSDERTTVNGRSCIYRRYFLKKEQ